MLGCALGGCLERQPHRAGSDCQPDLGDTFRGCRPQWDGGDQPAPGYPSRDRCAQARWDRRRRSDRRQRNAGRRRADDGWDWWGSLRDHLGCQDEEALRSQCEWTVPGLTHARPFPGERAAVDSGIGAALDHRSGLCRWVGRDASSFRASSIRPDPATSDRVCPRRLPRLGADCLRLELLWPCLPRVILQFPCPLHDRRAGACQRGRRLQPPPRHDTGQDCPRGARCLLPGGDCPGNRYLLPPRGVFPDGGGLGGTPVRLDRPGLDQLPGL